MDNDEYVVKIEEVPSNKRVSSIGEYSVMMFECPECEHDLTKNEKCKRDYQFFFNQCIGFGSNSIGMALFVFECPKCGCRFHFHARRPNVSLFFDFLDKRSETK